MRRGLFALGLAAFGSLLVAAVPGAPAQAATELEVGMHDEGNEFWFTIEGLEGRNPTLRLEPGATYTFLVKNVGTVEHNFHLGAPIDAKTALLDPGGEETLTVTVPETASEPAQYWCDPHLSVGMVGDLRYGAGPGEETVQEARETEEASPQETAGEEDRTPGPGLTATLAAAVAGALLLLQRRRR